MSSNAKPALQPRTLVAAAVVVLVAAAAGVGLYRWGVAHGAAARATALASSSPGAMAGGPASAPVHAPVPDTIPAGEAATRRHIAQGLKAGQIDPDTGKPILYYHDPMVPDKRFDAPGKSPFMDMMLVPVYGGAPGPGAADEGGVSISPRLQQSLGVRTAPVVEGVLASGLSAVGSVAWDERDQSVLQARAAGYVEKLYVRATLDRVARGQPVASLYVPEWVAAQEEYLALRRSTLGDAGLVAAARQRMLLAGMSEAQVAGVERSGTVSARQTLVAPSSGYVAELAVREGMSVTAGATLARINGLASVWAVAEVPEAQAARLRRGGAVEARSPGVPGEVYRGTVQAVLPAVSTATRTLQARIALANPAARLVPGMSLVLRFVDGAGARALLIPSEALIQTGRRTVVLLAEAGGQFRPVEVEAGAEAGGQTEIRRGLGAGQMVVVSSQFLIDSEASLKGVEARLNAAGPSSNMPPPDAHDTLPGMKMDGAK